MRLRVTDCLVDQPPAVGSLADIDALAAPPPAVVAAPTGAFIAGRDDTGGTAHSHKLLGLTGLALDRAADILRNTPDPKSDTFGDELRAVTSTVKTVLTTQLRVDENHLRQRQMNALPELLKAVAAEETKLATIKRVA